MSSLLIDHVTYSYDVDKPVLKDITWQIEKGEFHCLVGRSGCGKTSLLNIASGLLIPGEGAVYLNGQQVKNPMTDAGFVFQSPTLLEWKTVLENVLLPIELKRKSTEEEKGRAKSLLSLMKIDVHMHKYPQHLSGGQQSRVAIARALIKNPPYLFLDEPFAALDAITREELQDDLLAICNANKMTVLFITHDIAESVYLADCVAVMEEGQIIYDLSVDLPKPRMLEMRYHGEFNELSRLIRGALEGEKSK